MRRASRLMIIVLLGLFLALPAVATVSALPAAAQAADRLVAQPSTAPSSPGATTAPAGPKLKPETEDDKAESKRKLIIGGLAAALLVIVFWGRSVRRKGQKASGS